MRMRVNPIRGIIRRCHRSIRQSNGNQKADHWKIAGKRSSINDVTSFYKCLELLSGTVSYQRSCQASLKPINLWWNLDRDEQPFWFADRGRIWNKFGPQGSAQELKDNSTEFYSMEIRLMSWWLKDYIWRGCVDKNNFVPEFILFP